MLEIKRAGHSTLTTPDIERTVDYFTRIVGLGLAAREKNRVILAARSGWSVSPGAISMSCRAIVSNTSSSAFSNASDAPSGRSQLPANPTRNTSRGRFGSSIERGSSCVMGHLASVEIDDSRACRLTVCCHPSRAVKRVSTSSPLAAESAGVKSLVVVSTA